MVGFVSMITNDNLGFCNDSLKDGHKNGNLNFVIIS